MRSSFTQLASADSGASDTEEQHELAEETQLSGTVSTSFRASMRLDCVLVDPPPYKRRSQAEKIDDTSSSRREPTSSPGPSSPVKRQRVSYAGSLRKNMPALPTSHMKVIGGSSSAASTFGLLTPTSSATVQHTAYYASLDVKGRVSSSSETDIVCGTNAASEELTTREAVEDSDSQGSLIGKPSPDVLPGQSHTTCRETPCNKRLARRDPSPADFELLEIPEIPSWVSTGVPSEVDEGDFSEHEREMYLPPGLASIISAMKDTLAAERAARLRAETRYEQETRLRAAAQRDAEREVRLRVEAEHDAAQLRAENARIQQRHRDWIATTSSTLVENLAQFSERLLAEGIELAFPSTPSASHTLAATQRRGSSSGAAAAVHTMAVDY